MVVAIIYQAFCLLRQFIVAFHVVLAFPCAVQCQFQYIILISFQAQLKRISLRLDSIRIPSLRFLQTCINYECTIACDVELGRSLYMELTINLERLFAILNKVDHLYLTRFVKREDDIVIRIGTQTCSNRLGQCSKAFDLAAFPIAVHYNLQVIQAFRQTQFEGVFL